MSLAPQITNHRKIPIQASSDFCFFLMATSDKTKDEEVWDQKMYFQKVLDDVVSLNGLFTVAVFLGLSFAQPGQVQSLSDDRSGDPNPNMRKRVVAFEIASFSFFVFSGITAKSVKVFLYTAEKMDVLEERRKEQGKGSSNEGKRKFFPFPFIFVDKNARKRKSIEEAEKQFKEEKRKAHQNWMCVGGFYLSIYGTMIGCLLLLLAMFDVVQIKLGRLACHSKSMVATVSVMVSVIGLSLVIFFFTVTNGLKIAAQEIKAESKERKERRDKDKDQDFENKEEKKDANPQEAEQQV